MSPAGNLKRFVSQAAVGLSPDQVRLGIDPYYRIFVRTTRAQEGFSGIREYFFLIDGEVRYSCYEDEADAVGFARGYTGRTLVVEEAPRGWPRGR